MTRPTRGARLELDALVRETIAESELRKLLDLPPAACRT